MSFPPAGPLPPHQPAQPPFPPVGPSPVGPVSSVGPSPVGPVSSVGPSPVGPVGPWAVGPSAPPAAAPPAPPPGPGVTPPFPAPPIEGRYVRLWLGLGAAGLAVLLCCGGGLAAGIGLGVTGARAINERAHVAVGDYLDDVRAGRYQDAYDALCPDLRQRESPREFAERVRGEPSISGYDLQEVEIGSQIILPVDVRYAGGSGDTLRFELEQDSNTGEFEVCGIDG